MYIVKDDNSDVVRLTFDLDGSLDTDDGNVIQHSLTIDDIATLDIQNLWNITNRVDNNNNPIVGALVNSAVYESSSQSTNSPLRSLYLTDRGYVVSNQSLTPGSDLSSAAISSHNSLIEFGREFTLLSSDFTSLSGTQTVHAVLRNLSNSDDLNNSKIVTDGYQIVITDTADADNIMLKTFSASGEHLSDQTLSINNSDDTLLIRSLEFWSNEDLNSDGQIGHVLTSNGTPLPTNGNNGIKSVYQTNDGLLLSSSATHAEATITLDNTSSSERDIVTANGPSLVLLTNSDGFTPYQPDIEGGFELLAARDIRSDIVSLVEGYEVYKDSTSGDIHSVSF